MYSESGQGSSVEDDDGNHGSSLSCMGQEMESTVFIAFLGSMEDEDFQEKLDSILSGVPGLLQLDVERLRPLCVEPWNSVRVTFSVPRDAAERLRLMAQSSQQQLRDLGILSVQIEGEGAINVAFAQNRGQEDRVSGPTGAPPPHMRMDRSFPMHMGPGVRGTNPSEPMVSPCPGMPPPGMVAGATGELLVRAPLPHSPADSTNSMPFSPSMQQQQHQHQQQSYHAQPARCPVLMLSVPTHMQPDRQLNPVTLHFQHQRSQLTQPGGTCALFNNQIPVPAGWSRLPSGVLQPPPAQGSMGGTWRNGLRQVQVTQHPSVLIPRQPPPPYPSGSQQAGQIFNAMGQQQQPGNPQFMAPQPTSLQRPAGPQVPASPLPYATHQGHLNSKSPVSSPSPFRQPSPPKPGQNQAHLGPRLPRAISSPGRMMLSQQCGSSPPDVMVTSQQIQVAQVPLGALTSPSTLSHMQGSHDQTDLIQSNQSGMASQPLGSSTSQGNHTSFTGQVVQGQVGGETVVTRPQHSNPGLMGNQNLDNFNVGLQQRMTPPTLPGKGQLMGMGNQGNQSMMEQPNAMMAEMMVSQMQENKQGYGFSGQIMRSPNMQGNLVQFHAQMGQKQQQSAPQQIEQQQQQQHMEKQQYQQMMQQLQSQQQLQHQHQITQQQVQQTQHEKMQQHLIQQLQQLQRSPVNGSAGQTAGLHPALMQFQQQLEPFPQQDVQQHARSLGDNTIISEEMPLQQALPDLENQQPQIATTQSVLAGSSQFSGHGMPFDPHFPGQMSTGGQCMQTGGFTVNNDITLTSPLLVNLLQTDVSANHVGPSGKQGVTNQSKAKKKKTQSKKKAKGNAGSLAQAEVALCGLDSQNSVEVQLIHGDQGPGRDPTGSNLPDLPNRPTGFPGQLGDQRALHQIPIQFMQQQKLQSLQVPLGQVGRMSQGQQLGQTQVNPHQLQPQQKIQQQQQQHQPNHQQQQMIMLMRQQEQAKNRMPLSQGVLYTADGQRMPVSQQGNMPVMINLRGNGSVPPSPDKPRGLPFMMNPHVTARRIPVPDSVRGSPSLNSEEASGIHVLPTNNSDETGSGVPHRVLNQGCNLQSMKSGTSPKPQRQGASPQKLQQQQPQQAGTMPASHSLHFTSISPSSRGSRPKTPDPVSPRPYHNPLPETSRPPSTEPSEINLSPERLNASIAGLFPPKINIPLPPRQSNLNRGFDQQGLNPTTLKAIGQAPTNMNSLVNGNNNNQLSFLEASNKVIPGGKPGGLMTRTSPSNSRHASSASTRKTVPSPGHQKGTKTSLSSPTHQQPPVNNANATIHHSPIQPASQDVSGIQNPFHDRHGYPTDMTREGQGIQPEKHQFSQLTSDPPRENVISPPCGECVIGEPEIQEVKKAEETEALSQQGPKPNSSVALRDAPASSHQLLDSSLPDTTSVKPDQDHTSEGNMSENENTVGEKNQLHSAVTTLTENEPEVKSKLSSATSPKLNPYVLQNLITVVSSSSGVTSSSGPKSINSSISSSHPSVTINQNLSHNSTTNFLTSAAVLQCVPSGATIPSNQITIFVSSNSISSVNTTSSGVPALVSAVVTAPREGVTPREGGAMLTTTAHNSCSPQYPTTPVLINSILQDPASSIPPSTNVMSLPVTAVESVKLSTNLQLAQVPTSAQSPVNGIPNNQAGHELVAQVKMPSNQVAAVGNVCHAQRPCLGTLKQGKDSAEEFALKHSPLGQLSLCPNTAKASSVSKPLLPANLCSSPGTAAHSQENPISTTASFSKSSPRQVLMTESTEAPSLTVEKVDEQSIQVSEVAGQSDHTSRSILPHSSHPAGQSEILEGHQSTSPPKRPPPPVPELYFPPNFSPADTADPGPVLVASGAISAPPSPDGEQSPPAVVETSRPAPESIQAVEPRLSSAQHTGDDGGAALTENGDAVGEPEKSNRASRRSSWAEEEPDEGAPSALEVSDGGQRKRVEKPGTGPASVTCIIATGQDTNTGASPTQAKRRKSK